MYLGLDLGTSALKALLLDAQGGVAGEASAPLGVSRPRTGWSEQDPADWLAAAETVLERLASDHDLSAVRGIGLSGHMHGATLFDGALRALRPCILWNDTRAHREAAAMDADPRFRAITGNIVFPGFTAPKLAWLRAHEPKVFAATRHVLLPKDALRLWLVGEPAGEMSDASGTAWLDTAARDWSDELLAATGLDRAHMPRLVEGSGVAGELRATIARRFGLRPAIPVAGGAGDNAAAAIGTGVIGAGQAFLSLGTSGVLFAAAERYAPDPASALHTFCHALPGRWHQMGVVLAAADALAWYARLVGRDAALLTDELGTVAAPGSALFLPYLGGERTPHNDAAIRGAFVGLEHVTDRAAGTRAVLEGVAYAFRDSLDAMRATGTAPDRLIATGGGSRSDYWLALLASVLQLPIDRPAHGAFGASLGAARLAMIAAGDADENIVTPPPVARSFEPDPAMADAFDAAQTRYRAAYRALRSPQAASPRT